jgi:hypothetical protein
MYTVVCQREFSMMYISGSHFAGDDHIAWAAAAGYEQYPWVRS